MGQVGQHANKGVCEVPRLAAKQRTEDKIPSLSVSQGGQGVFGGGKMEVGFR